MDQGRVKQLLGDNILTVEVAEDVNEGKFVSGLAQFEKRIKRLKVVQSGSEQVQEGEIIVVNINSGTPYKQKMFIVNVREVLLIE